MTAATDPGPRFFVERAADGGLRLEAAEADHAARVLRLAPGSRCVGLDGRGAVYALEVTAVRGREVRVEAVGPSRLEPEPGVPGSPLPRVCLGVSFPRGARAEEMLERLVQVGAHSIAPLIAVRTPPRERERGPGRTDRLRRIARAACKQCGRAWLPDIAEPATVEAFATRAGPLCVAAPSAAMTLLDWLGSTPPATGTAERPLAIAVGPEGGFAPAELEALARAGASEVALGPLVLRVETAAEVAVALAVLALSRRLAPDAHHAIRSRSET